MADEPPNGRVPLTLILGKDEIKKIIDIIAGWMPHFGIQTAMGMIMSEANTRIEERFTDMEAKQEIIQATLRMKDVHTTIDQDLIAKKLQDILARAEDGESVVKEHQELKEMIGELTQASQNFSQNVEAVANTTTLHEAPDKVRDFCSAKDVARDLLRKISEKPHIGSLEKEDKEALTNATSLFIMAYMAYVGKTLQQVAAEMQRLDVLRQPGISLSLLKELKKRPDYLQDHYFKRDGEPKQLSEALKALQDNGIIQINEELLTQLNNMNFSGVRSLLEQLEDAIQEIIEAKQGVKKELVEKVEALKDDLKDEREFLKDHIIRDEYVVGRALRSLLDELSRITGIDLDRISETGATGLETIKTAAGEAKVEVEKAEEPFSALSSNIREGGMISRHIRKIEANKADHHQEILDEIGRVERALLPNVARLIVGSLEQVRTKNEEALSFYREVIRFEQSTGPIKQRIEDLKQKLQRAADTSAIMPAKSAFAEAQGDAGRLHAELEGWMNTQFNVIVQGVYDMRNNVQERVTAIEQVLVEIEREVAPER